MRRFAALLAPVLLLATALVGTATAEATPAVQPRNGSTYVIWTPADLDALFDDNVKWQGYTITLANNIDMAAYPQTSSIGTDSRRFTSTFDGNGRSITNLHVDVTAAGPLDVGLFGYLGAGHVVKDLTVTGTITGTSTGGGIYVGGIAGSSTGGEIRNVVFVGEVTGEASGNDSNSVGGLVGDARDDTVTQAIVGEGSFVVARGGQPRVGGLIGYAERPIITRSASVATVQALDHTDIYRTPLAAGLVASIFGRSTVRDTYFRGAVTSTPGTGDDWLTILGGILGSTSNSTPNSAVDRSYAFASLAATGSWQSRSSGGLIGNDYTFNTSRSFYDDTLAVGSSAGGNSFDDTRLTPTQQTQYSSYAGVLPIVPAWEASTDDTVWGICDGQGYPYLLWQVYGDPCILTNTVSGTPQVGQVLTADADTAAVNDVLSYQWGWYDGGVFTRINETPFSTYTVTSADVGHQMAVRVTSTAGTALATQISAPTAVVTAAPPPVVPPGAPTAVAAVPGDTVSDVSWTAPIVTGSFPITTYQVQASPGGASCLVTTTSCQLTRLTNGTSYSVQVRALNGAGWGAWSSAVDVTPETRSTPTIVITGSRDGRYAKVVGRTTGLVPGDVQAWVKTRGDTAYREGVSRQLDGNGGFTWKRKSASTIRVYFRSGDVRSASVTIRP